MHFKGPGKVFGGALIKPGQPEQFSTVPGQFSTVPLQFRVVMTVLKRKVFLHAYTLVNKISDLLYSVLSGVKHVTMPPR